MKSKIKIKKLNDEGKINMPIYKGDKLDIMFKLQKHLQSKLGIYNKIKTKADKQSYINQMILALHEEAVEIMRETSYKNPKYVKFGWKIGQKGNNENFKNEIVDILHFVLNLVIISGMNTDELFNRYIGKNKENERRKNNGY